MKLLTLDRWGAANLDKWREKNGDELELGKNVDELELDEQEKWRRGPSDRCIDESLALVGITNRN